MAKRDRCLRALALLALVLLGFAGCAGGAASDPAAAWTQAAGLDSAVGPDTLYPAALEEGGSLTVYTTTTRALDSKESFERQYPGLVVEMWDMRSSHLVESLMQEHASGGLKCDVVLCSDNSAAISGTLGPMGVVCKYVPGDMTDSLLFTDEEGHLPFMTEAQMFCYNGAAWDEPPFTNIWELCDARFYGRVYTPNPLSSYSTYALYETILRQDEAMREAYTALYGVPPQLREGETAGHEFMRRLAANGLVVTNSSDEVAEAVGAPGQGSQAVGTIISSKLRLNEVGYSIAAQYKLAPFAGVGSRNSAMVVVGTPRLNTAKLFIRWLLGETDGTGEGYGPFMQNGTWSARRDVADGDATPYADIHFVEPDKPALLEDQEDFKAFWLEILAQEEGAP